MSETPSSAVTTADAASSVPRVGRGGAVAVAPMAITTAGVDFAGADPTAEHAAALALDDQGPHDLLWPAPALVEFVLPDDAPLYAAAEAEDWSGATAAPNAGLIGTTLDLVYDGEGGSAHLAADAVDGDVMNEISLADPLVDLGPLAGAGFPALDAPAQVDVAVDASARVDLAAPDLLGPELSWLAALPDAGLHVGEAWAWSDSTGGYVFDHYV